MDEVDLYLRKSKITRVREKALTFRAQEDRGRRWAASEGLRVRHVWRDNLSAWSDVKRPEFDKAFAALEAGQVPALWCWAMDRWSRKGAFSLAGVLEPADGEPRRIVFDYEHLDSSDPQDRSRIIQEADRAREFSERLSTRVRPCQRPQACPRCPYGSRSPSAPGRDSPLNDPGPGRPVMGWPGPFAVFR
jgi:DNA invertase Pin-like site-specific DNA recombinase